MSNVARSSYNIVLVYALLAICMLYLIISTIMYLPAGALH
jgi:hypothetical protein